MFKSKVWPGVAESSLTWKRADDYTVTSPAAKWAAVKAAIPQAEKTLPGTFFISFASKILETPSHCVTLTPPNRRCTAR